MQTGRQHAQPGPHRRHCPPIRDVLAALSHTHPPPARPAHPHPLASLPLPRPRAATTPTGPLRQRGTHTGSTYLDSERITRDPLELRVGDRTSLAAGGPPALPDAVPLASRALAAAIAALGSATLAGLLPPLVLDSDAVLLGGEPWRLLAASLQPDGVLDGGAAATALLSGGAYAERRLGQGLFAAAFLLPGASAALVSGRAGGRVGWVDGWSGARAGRKPWPRSW